MTYVGVKFSLFSDVIGILIFDRLEHRIAFIAVVTRRRKVCGVMYSIEVSEKVKEYQLLQHVKDWFDQHL